MDLLCSPNIPWLTAGAIAGQGHPFLLHLSLFLFHDGLFVIGSSLPLHKGDGSRGTDRQTTSQPIAVIVPYELRPAFYHCDSALVAAAAQALQPLHFSLSI